jgi:hypothetical protein
MALAGLNSSPSVLSRVEMAPGVTYGNAASPGGVEARLGGAFTTRPLVAGTNGTGWGNSGVGFLLGPGQFNFGLR